MIYIRLLELAPSGNRCSQRVPFSLHVPPVIHYHVTHSRNADAISKSRWVIGCDHLRSEHSSNILTDC